MKKLLFPAVSLMNRMGIKFKFILILGLLLIPVIGLSYVTQLNVNKTLNTSYSQKEGLEVVVASVNLMMAVDEVLDEYTYHSVPPQNGNPERLKQATDKVVFLLADLNALAKRSKHLSFSDEQLQKIRSAWDALAIELKYPGRTKVGSAYEHFSSTMLLFTNEVGYSSQLYSASSVKMAHLADALVRRLPALLGTMGSVHRTGGMATSEMAASGEVRDKLLVLIERAEYQHETMELDLASFLEEHPDLKASFIQEDKSMHRFVDLTRQYVMDFASAQAISPEEYYLKGEEALTTTFKFFQKIAPVIEQSLEENVTESRRTYVALLIVVVGGILLLIYLLIGFYMSFMSSLKQLKASAEFIAAGDLTHKVNINTLDEMGQIGKAMEDISEGITRTVYSIVRTSNLFRDVAGRLALSSSITENSVSSQVRDSEETSKSISELSNTVSSVTQNIEQAADAAKQAKDVTRQGHQVVSDVISSVDVLANDIDRVAEVIASLSKESQQINGILDMIREIADQTNLLALNAAIEAARAGEHGRGFAVVADEVRSLAQKTHHATGDIQTMIEKLSHDSSRAVEVMHASETQLETTVEQVKKADQALNEITHLVGAISDMNSRIAVSAEQQSQMAKVLDNNVINMTSAASQAASVARSNVEDSSIIRSLASEAQSQINRFLIDDEVIDNFDTDQKDTLFKWDDSFSVDIPEIDRQHKILVGMLNELHQHVQSRHNVLFIKRVLQGLIDYTDSHFTYEEGLLERFEYPDIEQHKEKHRKLIAEVKGFHERLDSDENFLLDEVMVFLTEWLTNHIKGSDKEYSRDVVPKMAGSRSSASSTVAGEADMDIESFDDDGIDLF